MSLISETVKKAIEKEFVSKSIAYYEKILKENN